MSGNIIQSRARFEVVGYSPQTMRRVGEAALNENGKRWHSSQLVDGSPAPPLKASRMRRFSQKQQRVVEFGELRSYYALRKQKKGLQPTRDLKLTGALRNAMQVHESVQNSVLIGPVSGMHPRGGKRRTTFAGVLAINNWRARMWGIGPKEERAIESELQQAEPVRVKQP